MVTSFSTHGLRLVSRPLWQRVGLKPMAVIMSLAWVFVLIWLIVALATFPFNIYWSLALLSSTAAFACYLGFITYKLVRESFRDIVLEISPQEAVLTVVDRLEKKRSTQMVLLPDIKFAEYYPFQDSASIILHAGYSDMEVPLWALGTGGKDVVDFLTGSGVPVVNVQSDDKIPQ